jgi:hypothetical protein
MGELGDGKEKASVSEVEVAPESIRETPRREREPRVNFFRSPKAWWRQNYLSWRFYVTIYAGLSLIVSLVNIVALVAAIATHGVDKGGRITICEGSCGKARKSSFFARLFISGLGTYMLSASEYVMVSSPCADKFWPQISNMSLVLPITTDKGRN